MDVANPRLEFRWKLCNLAPNFLTDFDRWFEFMVSYSAYRVSVDRLENNLNKFKERKRDVGIVKKEG